VTPGDADGKQCSIEQPRFAIITDVGSRHIFSMDLVLTTFDSWGNRCLKGGAKVKAATRAVLKGTPIDLQDGTYVIKLEQQQAGSTDVSVTVNGVDMSIYVVHFYGPGGHRSSSPMSDSDDDMPW
tara:strand:- start:117 stop:491 length:375 start_codon:yes stop_codon:yes gene_type:complete